MGNISLNRVLWVVNISKMKKALAGNRHSVTCLLG
jgi:hypothetical protein